MNRKIVGISVLIAAVLYLGLTWGAGMMAHSQLNAWHQQAQTYLPYMKVVDRTVEQGLFSSAENVTYEMSADPLRGVLGVPAGPLDIALEESEGPEPLRFTLRNEIQHGPLPGFTGFGMARIDTTLVLKEETRQQLMTDIGTDKPYKIITHVGFLGGGRSEVSSPAFRYVHKATNTTVDWKGLESRFDFGRNMNRIEGSTKIPGVHIREQKEDGVTTVEIGEITLDADLKQALGSLYTGKASVAMAGFTVSKPGQTTPMMAKDARYDMDITLDDDFLDFMMKFGLDQVAFDKVDLSDVRYDLSVRHLHGPTTAEIQTRMQEFQRKQLAGDETAGIAALGLMTESLPRLLEHNPEFALDHLGFSLPEGSLKVSGKVSVPGVTAEDMKAGMMALIGKIEATVDIRISEGLLAKDWGGGATAAAADAETVEGEEALEMTPPPAPIPGMAQVQALKGQVKALEEQGYIKRNGDILESRIEFRNGALTVNGKPMGPPPGAEAAPY